MGSLFIVEYTNLDTNVEINNSYREYEWAAALGEFLKAIEVSENATLRWSS